MMLSFDIDVAFLEGGATVQHLTSELYNNFWA